ncbi:MAG: cupin domain-containing protein [Phycisphaeraceae bacterium]
MMMRHVSTAAAVLLTFAVAGWGVAAVGEDAEGDRHDDHVMVTPEQVDWKPGPPSLPEGSEMAVLEGDPAEPAFFVMQLKLPDGYVIPPHRHPGVERVTVLKGTFHLGMDEEFDAAATNALPVGSYFSMPPGMVHFAQAEGETVVQLSTIGPWIINYVDPADDPRQ